MRYIKLFAPFWLAGVVAWRVLVQRGHGGALVDIPQAPLMELWGARPAGGASHARHTVHE